MRLRSALNTRKTGMAASVLNALFASIVIMIGLFSTELSRYLLARDQLRGALEAAVLSCQTTLASTGAPTNSNNQTTAMQAGLSLFQQNAILGEPLSGASLVSVPSGQTAPQFDVQPNEAQICFQFLDPITHLPTNTSSGTLTQATGAYCYTPIFGQFIGLANAQFTFELSTNSGVPQLDLVFVYDVSSAENEETPVTFLQRFWHDPYGIDYLLPPPIGSDPPNTILGGPLLPFCPPTAPLQNLNPTTPQNLDYGKSCITPQLNYTEAPGAATQLLTGMQAYSAPPGNYPPGILVVDLAMAMNGTLTNNIERQIGTHIYVPCIYPHAGSTYISLSQYYPVLITDYLSSSNWAADNGVSIGWPYGSATSTDVGNFAPNFPSVTFIGYVPNGSSFPSTAAPGTTPSSGFSSAASAYQAPLTLQGNSTTTVNLAGGSSYGSTSSPMIPTGPYPPVTPGGSSSVASVLSGFQYSDYGNFFTDCVVNIDNNPTFQNASVNYNGTTFNFPNLATLVEASRGNLDSLDYAQGAGLNLGALGLSQSDLKSGYYAAYVQAALAAIQPMNAVANATIAFMNQLATVSDIHFGCITFNDYVGSNASSTAPPSGTTTDNIAAAYPYPSMNANPDGSFSPSTNNTYLLPDILLDPSGNTTQSTIANVLPTIHTWGNCNVATALQAALTELTPQGTGTSPARPAANKAIILITSQAPNVGLNGDTGTSALSDALSVAKSANQAGIPIYCVAIAQSSTDDTNEDAAYNANNGGLAAVAGHGSRYYRIDWSNPATTQTALTNAFGNIARQLVTIVR